MPRSFADYRKNSGLTLDGVAERFGVDRKTILRWEQGAFPIPADRVLEVEAITGISRHDLRPDLSRIFVADEPATPSNPQAAA
jgi:DNA-binding transcriptional regulator YdaS (Cro superfamily)